MNRRELLAAAGASMAVSNPALAARRPRGDEVVFLVFLELRPGAEPEFLRLLEPVLDAMRHEATFVNAALHRDPEDASRFMLYETWTDLADVTEVQVQREYRKAYWDRLPDLLRSPRQVQVWRPMRGDFTFF